MSLTAIQSTLFFSKLEQELANLPDFGLPLPLPPISSLFPPGLASDLSTSESRSQTRSRSPDILSERRARSRSRSPGRSDNLRDRSRSPVGSGRVIAAFCPPVSIPPPLPAQDPPGSGGNLRCPYCPETVRSNLGRHIRRRHAGYPVVHRCQSCPNASFFRSRTEMISHHREAHWIQCNLCDRRIHPNKFARHQSSHRCPDCPNQRIFADFSNLNRHRQQVHGFQPRARRRRRRRQQQQPQTNLVIDPLPIVELPNE